MGLEFSAKEISPEQNEHEQGFIDLQQSSIPSFIKMIFCVSQNVAMIFCEGLLTSLTYANAIINNLGHNNTFL